MRAPNREDTVALFCESMGQGVDLEWTPSLLDFRIKLIGEEFQELHDEFINILVKMENGQNVTKNDKANLLKEMADLQYVLSGMAVQLGLPLQIAFNRVHNSNMSKLDDNGEPIRREDGKIVKGPNYVPPTLMDLV